MSVELTKVSELLTVISAVALDPALGGRGLALSKMLGLLAVAINAKDKADDKLKELDDQLKAMQAEGRSSPTHEEWNAFQERSERAHAEIQAWEPSQPAPSQQKSAEAADSLGDEDDGKSSHKLQSKKSGNEQTSAQASRK
jgi:hypothetical protein